MQQNISRWRVNIIESERGWGQRVDETKLFDSREQADSFVAQFNARNNRSTVPGWYMYAEKPVQVSE
jgi:hypothetical protein